MNLLVIRTSDNLVVNVIVADEAIVAATAEFRLVEATGDLASAGIGWTITVDGVASPPASWLEDEASTEPPVTEPEVPTP
ncbi:hypothetical protein [Aurantimonas coralicida]|uniref:hypothetical protein n=1 Tax=Aurantimonas coralicida TaxID=182270 RepID=UPI001D18245D|nr:hypothetical protein [Aurantimonas coralicida]MCC4298437.1 hypothetical protein [Aurantimonas coralicida]